MINTYLREVALSEIVEDVRFENSKLIFLYIQEIRTSFYAILKGEYHFSFTKKHFEVTQKSLTPKVSNR
jgi:hypothetical protein